MIKIKFKLYNNNNYYILKINNSRYKKINNKINKINS